MKRYGLQARCAVTFLINQTNGFYFSDNKMGGKCLKPRSHKNLKVQNFIGCGNGCDMKSRSAASFFFINMNLTYNILVIHSKM